VELAATRINRGIWYLVCTLPDILIDQLRVVEVKEGKAFPSTNFTKAWRAACVKAGFGKWRDEADHAKGYEGLIVHDLRRSAIKLLIDSGVRETVVMKISGHKTASVFRRYNIVTTDDILGAMQRVQGKKSEPASVTTSGIVEFAEKNSDT
jgi:integrase